MIYIYTYVWDDSWWSTGLFPKALCPWKASCTNSVLCRCDFPSIYWNCEHPIWQHGEKFQYDCLENLPKEVQASFYSLCELAFFGLLEERMLFSKEELKLIPDTLSLLYGTKLQDETGSITKYSFFHPSIQELFAAIHMSRMLAYIPPPKKNSFVHNFINHTHKWLAYTDNKGISHASKFSGSVDDLWQSTVIDQLVYNVRFLPMMMLCWSFRRPCSVWSQWREDRRRVALRASRDWTHQQAPSVHKHHF